MPVNHFWFKKFFQKLVPEEEFAALEVSEKAVRYILFSKFDLAPKLFGEVKLEPGVIEKGELKNKASLIKALNELKRQAKCDTAGLKCSPVVISLCSANFFFNVLELPEIPEASYEEAVKLNSAQVSPINLDEAYFDWQNLGVNLKTLQREFLIGVASRPKIDAYLEVFNQVGFQPLALESRSLSLLRNFNYFSRTIEKNITLLLVDIGEDGISFLVSKSGKLFFDLYLFWSQIPEASDGKITRQDLEAVLGREVARILEYFSSHSQEQVINFSLFSPILKKELINYLAQKFDLREIPIALPAAVQNQAPDLYAGLIGAGLRGSLIPRSLDDIVSFLPEGTEKLYQESQLSFFVSLWAKISAAVLAGLGLIFLSALLLVNNEKKQTQAQLDSLIALPETAEISALNQQAEEFNRFVAQIETIEKPAKNWSGVLSALTRTAQELGISIARVSFSETSLEFRLRASAPNQQTALAFPEKIKQFDNLFADAEIPLSSFSQTPQGVEFEAIIKLKN
ncbi:MAG: pilus assembly protein PilM [Patescibacteria group bacterium]